MPAYMIELMKRCCKCKRWATQEVFNDRNGSMGYFCMRCARIEIKRLNT